MAKHRINLPKPVADIYRAVDALEQRHPGRKFTPDGHLVGSIGEVIAAGLGPKRHFCQWLQLVSWFPQ